MRRYILIAVLTLSAASQATAQVPVLCPQGQFTVTNADADLAARVCRVAEATVRDLAGCNLALDGPVEIGLAHTLSDDCIGRFYCHQARIEILLPDAMKTARDPDSALTAVPDDAFFDSVIVHELTHAASEDMPCPFDDCRATSEYLAYAMQIRSLAPEHIAAFDAASDILPPVERAAINGTILMMAPGAFAERAWAHFSQQDDSCALVGRIMSGDVLFDFEPF